MSLLGNLTVGILGNMSGLSGSFKGAQTEVEKFAKNVDKIGKSISDVGKKMSLFVTGPLVAIGTYAFQAGKAFDSQMSRVEAISGATGESLEKLRNQAKELGSTTVFMASQAAEGMEYLALAGWDAEAIYTAMPAMLNLAAAGALDLGRAADITSDTMQAFAMSADQAGHAADVFAYAQANANTSVEQMGEGMKYLAPVANALGWDLEQSATALMAVADAGVKGSMGGRAFATSLARLAKPTTAMYEEMDRLKLSFFDTNGEIKTVYQIVAELEKGLDGFNNEAKSAAITTLFGAEAYKHWAILLERGSGALEEMTVNLINSDGAAEEMANTMLDNLGGSMVMLKSAIEGAALSIYELAEGPIRALIDKVTEWVQKFIELDDSTKNMILIIGGLAAALGPVLIVLGTLVSSVGKLIPLFTALVSPVGLVVAAIGALVTGLVYLYNTNETVRDALSKAWEFLKSVAESVFGAIQEFWEAWGEDIMSFFTTAWELISSVFTAAINLIWEFIKTIFDVIKDFWDKWGADIVAFFQATWDILKTVWSTVFGIISDAVKFIFNEIKAFWDKWGSTIIQSFKNYFEILKIFWSTIFEAIFSAVKAIFEAIKWFWDNWGKTILGLFESVFKVLKTVFQGVWNSIKIIVETAIKVVSEVISFVLNVIKGNWKDAWGNIKNIVSGIWDGIKKLFKNSVSTMLQIGKDIIQGLINGIKNMASAVWDTAKDIAKGIGDGIKGFFGIKSPSRLMMGYGENIGEGLAIGMEDSAKEVGKATDSITKVVDERFTDTMKRITTQANQAATGTKKSAEKIKRSFNEAMSAIQHEYKTGNFSAAQYVEALNQVETTYAKTAAQRRKVSEEMLKVEKAAHEEIKAIDKATFENSKNYIEEKKRLSELSLTQELTAWERVHERYAEGSEERLEAERNIQRVRQEIFDQLTKANEDFLKKTQEINKNVEEEEKRLNEVYEKAVEERTKSIRDFAGLFDEVVMKADKTGEDLLENLRGQVEYLDTWSSSIEQLAKRGIDEGLLEELRQMGPKAAPELIALNDLTDEELEEYQTLWQTKTEQARNIAVNELQGLRADTDTEIEELHKRSAEQLEEVKKEFETKIKEIRYGTQGEFNAMKEELPAIGKQAMAGLQNGMESMRGSLMSTARSIADEISSTIRKAFDVRSPSRVMMKIGEYVGEGLAVGMESMNGMISRAAQSMVDSASVSLSAPELSRINATSSLGDSGKGLSGATVSATNQYTIERGAITISAKDLEEVRTIQEFFNRITQTARGMGVT